MAEEKMATCTYAKSVGGKGNDSDKLIIKNELTTYGCMLKPEKTIKYDERTYIEYIDNQCIRKDDIKKYFDDFDVIVCVEPNLYNDCYENAGGAVEHSPCFKMQYSTSEGYWWKAGKQIERVDEDVFKFDNQHVDMNYDYNKYIQIILDKEPNTINRPVSVYICDIKINSDNNAVFKNVKFKLFDEDFTWKEGTTYKTIESQYIIITISRDELQKYVARYQGMKVLEYVEAVSLYITYRY